MAAQPTYTMPDGGTQNFGTMPAPGAAAAAFTPFPSKQSGGSGAGGLAAGQQAISGGQQVMLMHAGMGTRGQDANGAGAVAPTATGGATAAGDVAMVDNMIGVPSNDEGLLTAAPAAVSSAACATAPPSAPSSTPSSTAPAPQQPPIAMYQIPAAMTTTAAFPTEHAVLVPYAAQVADGNDDAHNRTMRKHAWTTQEDETLMRMVHAHGPGRWSQVASHLPGRMGKQCRERWFNHLAPEVRKGAWTAEEDRLIMNSVRELGTKWSSIVKLLPGRSDNAIKNRYYSAIRKAHRQETRAHDVHSQQDENERAAKEAAQIAAASLGIDLRHAGAASTAPTLTMAPTAAEGVTAEAVVASSEAAPTGTDAAGRVVQAPVGMQTVQMQTASGQYQTVQISQGGMIMQVPVVQTGQGGMMMQQPVQMQAIQVPPGMQIAGLQPGQRQYVQLMQMPGQPAVPVVTSSAPACAASVVLQAAGESEAPAAASTEAAPATTAAAAAPAAAGTEPAEGTFLANPEWEGI
ncbi:hypothetical protein AB1Y20_020984 [Prymnesium parvum]|uniref:Uncharacterized protein n=1 Tax=Prymnesium parvum TaxID=97485 RepID=A0AB34JKS7_PRYPA